MPSPNHLFVYGTLRPGHAPASVAAHLDRCALVGPARTPGRLYDLRNYPGACIDASCPDLIHGQLLRLPDDATLKRFDAYEGFNPADAARSLFLRTECDVTLDSTGE